jgi:hypothetical protein
VSKYLRLCSQRLRPCNSTAHVFGRAGHKWQVQKVSHRKWVRVTLNTADIHKQRQHKRRPPTALSNQAHCKDRLSNNEYKSRGSFRAQITAPLAESSHTYVLVPCCSSQLASLLVGNPLRVLVMFICSDVAYSVTGLVVRRFEGKQTWCP